jgi:hypothetical protein
MLYLIDLPLSGDNIINLDAYHPMLQLGILWTKRTSGPSIHPSIGLSINRWMDRLIYQSNGAIRSSNQSMDRCIQSVNHWINLFHLSIKWINLFHLSIKWIGLFHLSIKWTNLLIYQSMNQSVVSSTDPWINHPSIQ